VSGFRKLHIEGMGQRAWRMGLKICYKNSIITLQRYALRAMLYAIFVLTLNL
jgi:hypothetical protein